MTETLEEHMNKQNTYDLVGSIERKIYEVADLLLELEAKGSPKKDTRRRVKEAAVPLSEEYRETRTAYYRDPMHANGARFDVSNYKRNAEDATNRNASVDRQRERLARALPVLARAGALLEQWDEWRRAVNDSDEATARKCMKLAEEEVERQEKERRARPDRYVTQADLADILKQLGINGSAPDGAPAA